MKNETLILCNNKFTDEMLKSIIPVTAGYRRKDGNLIEVNNQKIIENYYQSISKRKQNEEIVNPTPFTQADLIAISNMVYTEFIQPIIDDPSKDRMVSIYPIEADAEMKTFSLSEALIYLHFMFEKILFER